MRYVREELVRSTGELVLVDIGDWITVTELGERYEKGRNEIRAILHHMGLLGHEGGSYRLPRWAVKKGLGLRHDKPRKSRYAFDVISPLGQYLIDQVWEETVRDYEADRRKDARVDEARSALDAYLATRVGKLEARHRVWWVRDHFRNVTHEAVAKALEISPTLARKYADEQNEQREFWERYKAFPTQESAFDPVAENTLAPFR